MRGFVYPIMIGRYDKPDKCSAVAKDDRYSGYSFYICRLKSSDGAQWGDTPSEDEIGEVICHLHFCKLVAAKAFIKALQMMVDKWEEKNE